MAQEQKKPERSMEARQGRDKQRCDLDTQERRRDN
jgi:hypothetical protein